MSLMREAKVQSVRCGKIERLRESETLSAMRKMPVEGRIYLGWEGLEGDAQADTEHHGGREKAVLQYALDHYAAWREELPHAAELLGEGGAFGENISSLGWTEEEVCLGDIVRWGEAFLQVCQARQPCFKLNIQFGHKQMARRVQATGRTGWYYRVLTAGFVCADDPMILEKRPAPKWPISRVQQILYVDTQNTEALEALRAMPWLSESWRRLANRRLETRSVEDWSERLGEESGESSAK